MAPFPAELRHGSGAPMRLDTGRLLVQLTQETTEKDLATRLGDSGYEVEGTDDQRPRPIDVRINTTPTRYWVRRRDGGPADPEKLQGILGGLLASVGPVYGFGKIEGPGGRVAPLPDVLLVRLSERVEGSPKQVAASLARALPLTEVKEKSEYLAPWRYFQLEPGADTDAYALRDELAKDPRVADARLENMPMAVPTAVASTDPLFAQQWDMTQISAGGPGTTAWDINIGGAATVVAVLDEGCDLGHVDLAFTAPGINLGTMSGDGSPTGNHGTACAGIVGARFDNGQGVSGVAGGTGMLPIAFSAWTDAEVAAGINYAATHGARIISMSFGVYAPGDGQGPTGWDFNIIDPVIANAVDVAGLLLVAATGNENISSINRYPARNPRVMAVGASDRVDARKSPSSPDGETWWGSNWGPGVSVVAPGVQIPTTDRTGGAGYTSTDYDLTFNGTSSATPHVAGLAALVMSQYPTLSAAAVRTVIERTADRVGPVGYADAAGFPNGPRNQAMGYGRINAYSALDLADVYIRDWPGDDGTEPSAPAGGDFWDYSDIVVRIFDDGVFDPADPGRSRNVERGQTNHVYVRVTNRGPRDAHGVTVSTRITPFVGLQFVYPSDWLATDAMHVSPTPVTSTFASIPMGGSVIAHFTISAAQVEDLWGWETSHPWHPCLLAEVRADNDRAAMHVGSDVTTRANNLAQRNLTVIDVLSTTAAPRFPFVVGHRTDLTRAVGVTIDASRLPVGSEVLLALDDDDEAFPLLQKDPGKVPDDLVFIDRTRVRTVFGCCHGVLTLEAGSSFSCGGGLKPSRVEGAEVVIRDGKRYARVLDGKASVQLEKAPGAMHPLAVDVQLPAGTSAGDYSLLVSQQDEAGVTVGGATAIYRVG